MYTSADTKHRVHDTSNDYNVGENPGNSVLLGWYGCPFTPVTGVRLPVGTPIIL
jgi:hypothetical protein